MDGTGQHPIFELTTITHRRIPIFHALLAPCPRERRLPVIARELMKQL